MSNPEPLPIAFERASAENEGEPVAELVQRLRGRADWYDDAHPGTVKTPQALREAARTIERLQRELDEARRTSTGDWASQRENDHLTIEKYEWRDRAVAAEASLVKAREALKKAQRVLATLLDPNSQHVSTLHDFARATEAKAAARAVLGDQP